MKKVKKIISCFLVMSFLACSLPLTTFADSSSANETYTSDELGVTFERIVEDDQIVVYTKSLDGILLHTAINKNGKLYLDNELVETEDSNSNMNMNLMDLNYDVNEDTYTRSSPNWGSWSNDSTTFKTGGLSSAAIGTLIITKVGWTPTGVAAAIASVTAGKYDEITVEWKMRFAHDDKYQYVERITTFYGDDKKITVPGNPYRENLKRPLDY